MMATAYSFGDFELIAQRRLLLHHGRKVPLGGRAIDLLIALVEKAGELVPKDELIARTWPGMVVEDANLRVHISTLRKALGEQPGSGDVITNIPGRGYSLAMQAERTPAPDPGRSPCIEAGSHRLPALLAPLIGRDELAAKLADLVQTRRLITLSGPAGIGKSVMAIALGQALSLAGDEVRHIDLSSASSEQALGPLLAVIDAILATPGSPVAVDGDARDGCVTIILDNCDHLVEAIAGWAEEKLRYHSQLRLLATSREPLQIEGEWVERLTSLEHRAVDDREGAAPAVRLFLDRAHEALGGFAHTARDLPLVALICERLDGIPLAIELAAAQLDFADLRTLARMATETPWILARTRSPAVAHHRSVAAMLDRSIQSLGNAELTGLIALSRIGDEFRLADVEELCRDASLAVPAGAMLRRLIAKSLIELAPDSAPGTFRISRLMKAYVRGTSNSNDGLQAKRLIISHN